MINLVRNIDGLKQRELFLERTYSVTENVMLALHNAMLFTIAQNFAAFREDEELRKQLPPNAHREYHLAVPENVVYNNVPASTRAPQIATLEQKNLIKKMTILEEPKQSVEKNPDMPPNSNHLTLLHNKTIFETLIAIQSWGDSRPNKPNLIGTLTIAAMHGLWQRGIFIGYILQSQLDLDKDSREILSHYRSGGNVSRPSITPTYNAPGRSSKATKHLDTADGGENSNWNSEDNW